MASPAQERLLTMLRQRGGAEEYWWLVNDWVRYSGPARSLALTNITRTMAALLKARRITIDDDGAVHLREDQ